MKISYIFFILSFFMISNVLLSSQTMHGGLEIHIQPNKVLFSMKKDKKFTLTIKNTSEIAQSLHLANDIVQNIVVDVFDEIDFPVSANPTITSKRQDPPIAYKNFILNPGKTYSSSFDLDDFVSVTTTGVYRVSIKFFPLLYTQKNKAFYSSNTVLVSILTYDPPLLSDSNSTDTQDTISDTSMFNNNMNKPDDVVNIALTFLQNKDWKNFLKMVDLQALYLNIGKASKEYNTLTREQQQAELIQFSKRLSQTSDNDDLSSPDYFRIDETRYTNINAVVSVTTRTVVNTSNMIRRYQFYLKKIKTHWKIVDYSIQIIGMDPIVTTPQNKHILTDSEYIAPDDIP